MSTNPNHAALMLKGRQLIAKCEVHGARSGEVSASLRAFPECDAFYEQLQQSEITLHEVRNDWETQAAASSLVRDADDRLRRQIVVIARAAVALAEIAGLPRLSDVLVTDADDEASMATRLAREVKGIPYVGHGFSTALTEARAKLLSTEADAKKVTAAFDAVTREFGLAFYRAAAVLAQGKTMLFSVGVKVAERKAAKRPKKKPTANEDRPADPPAKRLSDAA